jgi:glyoxylase-like metal-dependent hydrolase (beta-lactamase superfamily II)
MAKVPEQVASGVYRVDAGPYSNAISVLLIADEEGWALVDAGTPASPFRIQGALASLEVGPDELKRIYLTHHHPDHIGGLQGVLWWATQAEVVAPRLEARIISGEHPPDIPPSKLGAFIARRQPLSAQKVDRVVHEGDGGFNRSVQHDRFLVLSGLEVHEWRDWVVLEGCRRRVRRSCGSGGGPGSP